MTSSLLTAPYLLAHGRWSPGSSKIVFHATPKGNLPWDTTVSLAGTSLSRSQFVWRDHPDKAASLDKVILHQNRKCLQLAGKSSCSQPANLVAVVPKADMGSRP